MSNRFLVRQSNLELLRIIAMVMIVGNHFVTYNNFGPTNVFSDKTLILSMLRLGGKLGVILFVMITGYFIVNKPFKWSRIFDLSKQTIYYSIVMAVLAYILIGIKPGALDSLKIIFPLLLGNYWFPTDFAIVLLISPLLNIVINNVNQKTMGLGILGMIALIGLPFLTPDVKNSVIGLTMAYLLGAYVRKYNLSMSKLKSTVLLGIVLILTTLITGLLIYTAQYSKLVSGSQLFFVQGFNVSAYSAAFLIFMLFKSWEFGNVKIINIVASTTFGVYLFHDNRTFRNYMWHDIIDPVRWSGWHLVIGFFGTIIGIFIVGMLLDFVRQFIDKGLKKAKERFI